MFNFGPDKAGETSLSSPSRSQSWRDVSDVGLRRQMAHLVHHVYRADVLGDTRLLRVLVLHLCAFGDLEPQAHFEA